MKCNQCGHEVRDAQPFCENCGACLADQTGGLPPAQGESAGGQAQRLCPACQSPVPESLTFCTSCGARVEPPPEAPSQWTAPTREAAAQPKAPEAPEVPEAIPLAAPEVFAAPQAAQPEAQRACPACQSPVPEQLGFCPACGKRMEESPAPQWTVLAQEQAANAPQSPSPDMPTYQIPDASDANVTPIVQEVATSPVLQPSAPIAAAPDPYGAAAAPDPYGASASVAKPAGFAAVCPHCGATNPAEYMFCKDCGKSMRPPEQPAVEPESAADGAVCPHCGLTSPAGYMFCKDCGKPMSAQDAKPAPDAEPAQDAAPAQPAVLAQPPAAPYGGAPDGDVELHPRFTLVGGRQPDDKKKKDKKPGLDAKGTDKKKVLIVAIAALLVVAAVVTCMFLFVFNKPAGNANTLTGSWQLSQVSTPSGGIPVTEDNRAEMGYNYSVPTRFSFAQDGSATLFYSDLTNETSEGATWVKNDDTNYSLVRASTGEQAPVQLQNGNLAVDTGDGYTFTYVKTSAAAASANPAATQAASAVASAIPATPGGATTQPTQQGISGDLNGDGQVTPFDALKALQIATGAVSATPEEVQAAAITGGDTVTVYDALKLLQMAAGISGQV